MPGARYVFETPAEAAVGIDPVTLDAMHHALQPPVTGSPILPDAVAQLLIDGQLHPGAARVIGPVLINIRYAVTRAVTNRVARVGWGRRH